MTCESWHRDELVCGYRRSSRKPSSLEAANRVHDGQQRNDYERPTSAGERTRKPVEVEAADSTSEMASSPVTAEDTTVTIVID